MKKLLLSALIIGSTGLLTSSCNKVVDQIKSNLDPFTYTAPEITIELTSPLPAGQLYNSQDQTYDFNISEILKDNVSSLNVSLDDVSKVTLEKVTLHLENGDDDNNWTNFETASVTANTDKGVANSKADLSASKNIENTTDQKYTDQEIVFDDNNLKDYVNNDGTKVTYSMSAKSRSDVNKDLTITAKIQYSFKF